MIYFETARAVKGLDYETKGRLFEAIMEYAEFGVVPELDGVLAVVWPFVADKVDRDSSKYEEIRAARAEAGRKGGKARAENMKQSQANKANATFDKQSQANKANATFDKQIKQIKPSAPPTTPPTATASPTTSTASERGLRDNEERDKGVTCHTPTHRDNPDVNFEKLRQEQIAKLEQLSNGGMMHGV